MSFKIINHSHIIHSNCAHIFQMNPSTYLWILLNSKWIPNEYHVHFIKSRNIILKKHFHLVVAVIYLYEQVRALELLPHQKMLLKNKRTILNEVDMVNDSHLLLYLENAFLCNNFFLIPGHFSKITNLDWYFKYFALQFLLSFWHPLR